MTTLMRSGAVALAALGALLGALLPAPAVEPPVSVFVVAHQDDELISFGSGIRQHHNAGHQVVVVLATSITATAPGGRRAIDRAGSRAWRWTRTTRRATARAWRWSRA